MPYDLSNRETLIALLERHEFLGTTCYGGYEGIDYSAGRLDDRWLSQPFGVQFRNDGEVRDDVSANVFAWDYENGEHDWTMKRYSLKCKLT